MKIYIFLNHHFIIQNYKNTNKWFKSIQIEPNGTRIARMSNNEIVHISVYQTLNWSSIKFKNSPNHCPCIYLHYIHSVNTLLKSELILEAALHFTATIRILFLNSTMLESTFFFICPVFFQDYSSFVYFWWQGYRFNVPNATRFLSWAYQA